MSYKALDVARYIINKSHDGLCYGFSNLKLQRFMYLLEKIYESNEEELFQEKFSILSCGPILENVNEEFRKYGNNWIPRINKYFVYLKENPNESHFEIFDSSILSEGDKNKIDYYIIKFGNLSQSQLLDVINKLEVLNY